MNIPILKIIPLLLWLFLSCASSSIPIQPIEGESIMLLCVQKEGKIGFIDDLGREIIPCEFDETTYFSEGWVALKKGKNWSYYDGRGRKVLDLKNRYTYCGKFHDGAAIVSTIRAKGDLRNVKVIQKVLSGDLQYIDKNGEVLFKIKNEWGISYKSLLQNGFSEGLLKVQKETDPVTKARIYGYLDKSGALKIPFQFTALDSKAEKFSEGLAVAGIREYLPNVKLPIRKYGYIDRTGNWKIPPIHTKAFPFKNGAAVVWDTIPNTKYGIRHYLIDTAGKPIFPPEVETYSRNIRDSLVAIYRAGRTKEGKKLSNKHNYALAKVDGTMLTDFIFAGLSPGTAPDDLWRASLADDWKKIGYLNDKLEVVIPYQYGWTSSIFENGLAVVNVKQEEGAFQAVINTKGEFVLPPNPDARYQLIGPVTDNAVEGLEYINKLGERLDLEGKGYEPRGIFQVVKLLE